MATKAQKTKVGIFVLVSLAIIVGGIAYMLGASIEPYTTYYLEFEQSVLGLGVGGLVEYLGVPVGSVEDIYIGSDGKARVEIRVKQEKVRIHEGVAASLSVSSLAAGTMAVHLEGGDPSRPILPEGTTIPAESSILQSLTKSIQSSVNSMDEVLESLGDAADQVSKALSGMEDGAMAGLLSEVEGLAKDSRTFLSKTETTMEDLSSSVDRALNEYTKIAKDIQWLADDIGETAESATGFMNEARAKLEPLDLVKAQADLERALQQFADLAEGMNGMLANVNNATDSLTHDVDNMEHAMRETLSAATEVLNSLRTTVTDIQQDPSSLVRGRGKPKSMQE